MVVLYVLVKLYSVIVLVRIFVIISSFYGEHIVYSPCSGLKSLFHTNISDNRFLFWLQNHVQLLHEFEVPRFDLQLMFWYV